MADMGTVLLKDLRKT